MAQEETFDPTVIGFLEPVLYCRGPTRVNGAGGV